MESAGYSGKSLAAKLGFKAGQRVLAIGAPDDYERLLGAVPEDVAIVRRGSLGPGRGGPFDLVHVFCPTRARLEADGPRALALVAEGGALWVSWPKKSSKLYRDLTEDGVRAVMLPTGWVDVKVCAVDGDWSGLKFLRRVAR